MSDLTNGLRRAAAGKRVTDRRDLEETAAWTIDQLTEERDRLVRELARHGGLSEDEARVRYGVKS